MLPIKIDLPEHFLEEEERCGYVVSEKMKKIWAVQLDLLAEVDRVCRKYNIKYFASSGTILGAVRHKGFIPWDDDIDLMLMRSEYEKLCKVAKKEFAHPYFFQTEETDKTSLRRHAQLRNSLTTGIMKSEYPKKYKFNQGIFIDIFPMDAITDNDEKFEALSKEAAKVKKKYSFYVNMTDRFFIPEKKDLKFCIKYLAHLLYSGPLRGIADYEKYYNKYEELCKRCNEEDSEMLGLLCLRYGKKNLRYRSDFLESVQMPFEFMEVPVPKNYDHALTHIYGDYMTFKKGVGVVHGGIIFDPEKPYTEYYNQEEAK